MARGLLHQVVKDALLKDGWNMTHDPYRMEDYEKKKLLNGKNKF
jgi:XisH protein